MNRQLRHPFRQPRDALTQTSPRRLIGLFSTWKALLLAVAAASPGPGYDTSTQILFDQYQSSESWLAAAARWLAIKLTRWDAVYFTNTATRGLLYEQEWAFSPALSTFASVFARVSPHYVCGSEIVCHAWAGIIISHLAHLGAVVVLWALTYQLIPGSITWRRQIAFTTACLHIISPAGLFLSSFYGESTFALLNFTAMMLLVAGQPSQFSNSTMRADGKPLLSGLILGLASTVRSNGLLTGIVMVWDALAYLPRLQRIIQGSQWRHLKRLAGLVLGGLLVLQIQIVLQGTAWWQYCTKGNSRPWCTHLPPSIYTWVQKHYWGVGFLRYWTLSNLPLFLLALPMMLFLVGSGLVALTRAELIAAVREDTQENDSAKDESSNTTAEKDFASLMARFALPQLVLAILALTSFHVQIINRISSGYPVWYIVLAIAIHADGSRMATKKYGRFLGWVSQHAAWLVRLMVMYAIVQGGLYASFLPPA